LKKSKKKILIKLAYSKSIGTGHFYRCIYLAKKLIKRKVEVYICKNKNFKKFEKNLLKQNKIIYLNKTKSIQDIKKFLVYYNIQNLLVDDPEFSFSLQKKIYKFVKNFFVYQDIPNKNYCDVLINHNLIADGKKKYKNISKKNTRFLLGINNFFLEENIKNIKKTNTKILVFFGGVAKTKLIKKVLEVLSNNKLKNYKFHFIIGKLSRVNSSIIKTYKSKRIKISYSIKQKKFHKLIKKSKFIICSGGTTLMEAIIFRTFPFVIQTANNQKYNISNLKKKRRIIYIGKQNFKKNFLISNLISILSKHNIKLKYKYKKKINMNFVNSLSNKVYECLNI
tara:strand:- start:31801 stop:32811 length:1011 start_codon:yes stop_codon:yes gene_type:complete